MTGSEPVIRSGRSAGTTSPEPAVFFLSDYGTADEFVGVVHAVLHRLVPSVTVIDLSHQVPAFDIVAGAAVLVRSAPYLGSGVVLAVVDPGVGTDRRGVAIEVSSGGPRWLIGPDNGLLGPLSVSLGGARAAVALDRSRLGGTSASGTFDGRDVFAPAAAHLVGGGDPDEIGAPVEPDSLATVPTAGAGARRALRGGPPGPGIDATAAWIDRFGNVQLDVVPEDLSALGVEHGDSVRITVGPAPTRRPDTVGPPGPGLRTVTGRWVHAFGQLDAGEFGLLVDANGQVAVVLAQASAALDLGLTGPGAPVHLAPGPDGDPGP